MASSNKKDSNEILKLFGTLFLIMFIAFALGAFIKNKSKPKIETEYSNGFTFTKSGNFWYTSILNPRANQQITAEFRYSPSEVKNIAVKGNPNNFFRLLQNNNLTGAYFTFNPLQNTSYMALAGADLSKFLKVINGVTLVAACTLNETEACRTRPIVTCENQMDKAVVIYIKSDKVAGITMEKNCLTIQGEGIDLVRAYNKLLFIWYSII